MPKILCKIEKDAIVACSGGADSLAALLFVYNFAKRKPSCLFVDHRTSFSKKCSLFVKNFCEERDIPFISETVDKDPPKGASKEHYWGLDRRMKYLSFRPRQVITGHTFDDAVEKFIMKSLSGSSEENRFHRIRTLNICSPFLLWTKDDCKRYLLNNNVEWLDDPANFDGSNLRSFMRMSSFVDICNDKFSVKSVVKKNIEKQFREEIK